MVCQSCAVQLSKRRNCWPSSTASHRRRPAVRTSDVARSCGSWYRTVLPQDLHCVPRSLLADRTLVVANPFHIVNKPACPPFFLVPRAPIYLAVLLTHICTFCFFFTALPAHDIVQSSCEHV